MLETLYDDNDDNVITVDAATENQFNWQVVQSSTLREQKCSHKAARSHYGASCLKPQYQFLLCMFLYIKQNFPADTTYNSTTRSIIKQTQHKKYILEYIF